jgi:hypothetical protein
MTTIAAGRLSETLQNLIDARLDTIDRMLLGRVNRQDRLAIVREVETQIFDLLQGRDTENLDRDDVLAALARLDPPEAYLPDEASGEVGPVRFAVPSRAIRPPSEGQGRKGLASGVLGIISMAVTVIPILMQLGLFSDAPQSLILIIYFGSIGVIFVLGLLAVINAARAKLRDGWAIAGLVTGIIAMFAGVLGILFI